MIETFHGKVRDLSHKGLGVIDHPDGRVFFVRGVWPGDEGEFSVESDALKYSEASLLKLTHSSVDRVDVPCPHRGPLAGLCGGCPWMMASYESQIQFKVKRLKHALEKRKVLVDDVLNPPIFSPQIYGYRNRAQFKTDGNKIGYVSEGTSKLAPIEDCLILNTKLNKLFHEIKETLPKEEYKPTGNHHWCFIDVDDQMKLTDVVINKRRPFRQGNTAQNEVMQKWVKEKFANLPTHVPVIDLFCGSGNFTEVISKLGFQNILAVEVQGSALDELRTKNLSGVRVHAQDMMEKGAWAKVARLQPHAKAILIDPPREGVDKRRGLFKYLDNLEIIFYISCELDTFARDAEDFIRNGWKLSELTPIDLFPHTPHVEIMSVFRR